MAVTTQEIEMLGCDAEACEVKAPAVDGAIPEKFEAGFVHLRYLDDKPVTWVACRKTHIGAAVLAAKARALAETPDPEPAPETAQAQVQPGDEEPERGDEDDNDGERRRRAEEEDLEALNA